MNSKKTTERFSDRVENYVKYRPHYPAAIIDYLNEAIHFNSSFIVADIGSGTGILTELFLKSANKIFAVEPNAAMRLKAEELFNQYENFKSIEATAEATTLDDNSVSFIISGQAFHWFDAERTKTEFKRIAKQNTYCVLVWNERQTTTELEKVYENFLIKYATDYETVNHTNITSEKIDAFFHPEKNIAHTLYNHQDFNYQALEGRLLSSSYISLEKDEKYFSMLEELKAMFEKYQTNNTVTFNYFTKLFLGKIK